MVYRSSEISGVEKPKVVQDLESGSYIHGGPLKNSEHKLHNNADCESHRPHSFIAGPRSYLECQAREEIFDSLLAFVTTTALTSLTCTYELSSLLETLPTSFVDEDCVTASKTTLSTTTMKFTRKIFFRRQPVSRRMGTLDLQFRDSGTTCHTYKYAVCPWKVLSRIF